MTRSGYFILQVIFVRCRLPLIWLAAVTVWAWCLRGCEYVDMQIANVSEEYLCLDGVLCWQISAAITRT